MQDSACHGRSNKECSLDVWPEHVWQVLIRGTCISSPTRISLTCELKGVKRASSLDSKYGSKHQQSSNMSKSGIIYELTGAFGFQKMVSSAIRCMKNKLENKLLARKDAPQSSDVPSTVLQNQISCHDPTVQDNNMDSKFPIIPLTPLPSKLLSLTLVNQFYHLELFPVLVSSLVFEFTEYTALASFCRLKSPEWRNPSPPSTSNISKATRISPSKIQTRS